MKFFPLFIQGVFIFNSKLRNFVDLIEKVPFERLFFGS